MKATHVVPLLAAGLVAVVASPRAVAGNDDQCRNIHFQFVNQHQTGKTIRVEGVEYLNVVNNRRVTVSFVPLDCDYNATCRVPKGGWPGLDLKDIEGNDIKDIKFVYREKDRQGNFMEPWSRGAGPFNDRHKECRADRTYGEKSTFAITGSIAPTASQSNPKSISSSLKSVR